jgi:hypothetical protein
MLAVPAALAVGALFAASPAAQAATGGAPSVPDSKASLEAINKSIDGFAAIFPDPPRSQVSTAIKTAFGITDSVSGTLPATPVTPAK